MADKKTKREFFTELLALATSEEQKTFIAHEIELLDKKHDSKKPSKVQEANGKVKEDIVLALGVYGKPMTISALQKDSMFDGFSNQKMSSLVKQLIDEGKIVRTEEKRVAYFSVPEAPEELDETPNE